MEKIQKEKALELALVHTLILPTTLLVIFGWEVAILYIGTFMLLHIARLRFDYSNFNSLKTYYYTLFIKGTVVAIVFLMAIKEMLYIAVWLMNFYK